MSHRITSFVPGFPQLIDKIDAHKTGPWIFVIDNQVETAAQNESKSEDGNPMTVF
jgi:hypothetical protein